MLDEKKLREAQKQFLMQYPQGFNDPEMIKIGKKHKMDKMVEQAQNLFSLEACTNIHQTADNMIKVVSASSMVSLFEKPKFRDYVRQLNEHEKEFLVNGLSQLLHGKSDASKRAGFEAMVDLLKTAKLAKWSLVTIIPAYYAPTKEVFVKPTTAKNVLKYFELDDPIYKPTPYWDFYKKYRRLINNGKKLVDKNLSPSNAAFSGFLMMTTQSAHAK